MSSLTLINSLLSDLSCEMTKTESFELDKVQLRDLNDGEEVICDKICSAAFGDVSVSQYFQARLWAQHRYVAVYNNEIIGCLIAQTLGVFRIMGPICVNPQYHGKGIGKKLLKHFLNSNTSAKINFIQNTTPE